MLHGALHGWLSSCRVLPDRRGSDHLPLDTLLTLPWAPRTAPPVDGTALPRARWDHHLLWEYSTALREEALAAACTAAAAGDGIEALTLLLAEVTWAATISGMPRRLSRAGPARLTQPPLFDAQCRRLKSQSRRCMRHWPDSPDSRALLREYFSVTHRKRRAWALSYALALLRELRADPRALYKRAKPAVPRLPVALQATCVWEAFVRELAQRPDPPGVGLPPAPPAQPTAAQAGPAAELNAAFSAAEVRTGLQLLRNGRSASSSGLPAEFLRYAYGKPSSPDTPAPHRLQPALAELYNSWFQAGAVPDAANVSLVTPIYKRGDAAQPSNYRPIAVGEPVTRLYAALLNVRLVAYTERAGLRAPSQAGFRPCLSTQHQLFCLQHLVDRATHLRQPLFCCFLDLKGAYNRVPRALLWQALQRLGVHGRMLGALQSLYSNAEYAINVGGRRGVGVRSTRGVKQGCPLSPTLFGLLLDGLHWALLAGAPDAGPQLACSRSVPDLGYADDVCLLATWPAHLQRLLDVAHGFLTSVGMELSVNKTCVMAFGVAAAAKGVAWSCGGVRLERVEQYKYLGVTFSAAAGIAAAFPALRGRLVGGDSCSVVAAASSHS
ncbi:hypothetical protein WJX81_005419 [Elliptochloris bilobata]|uniref:Reverse transcriptase domain-containing protein n=1 Tax=Elliptochloris bilobata TaxID=381761 RepID=A0AAW1RS59_9CHLO